MLPFNMLGVQMGKDGLTANSIDATANQQLGLCPTNFLPATGSTKTTQVDWIKMFWFAKSILLSGLAQQINCP